MKRETLQKILGDSYRFQTFLTEDEVQQLQRQCPEDFSERPAAVLTAGCVRISAVLFRGEDSLHLGYDILVKDNPGSSEWICYDNPEDAVRLEEDQMLAVLDRVVRENDLSYTHCFFQQLEDKRIAPEKKPGLML